MNWYTIAKSQAALAAVTTNTNFSNYLNSNFENGWGTLDHQKDEKDKKKKKKPNSPYGYANAVDGECDSKTASVIQPVAPAQPVGDKPRSQRELVELIKRRQQEKQPVNDTAPAEDGKGGLIDVKASVAKYAQAVREHDLDKEIAKYAKDDHLYVDDLETRKAKGHGRTIGSCGHVISRCRCSCSGDPRMVTKVDRPCRDCGGPEY